MNWWFAGVNLFVAGFHFALAMIDVIPDYFN
jgi:hypothetical protein